MGLHRFSPSVIYLGSYPRADRTESVHLGNNNDVAYTSAKSWLDSLRG
jgi:prephenate dehydratase